MERESAVVVAATKAVEAVDSAEAVKISTQFKDIDLYDKKRCSHSHMDISEVKRACNFFIM